MTHLTALLFTVVTECLVALIAWACFWRHARHDLARWVTLAIAVSLVTHPFAWWLNMSIAQPFWLRALLIESGVVIAEAAIFWRVGRLPWPSALAMSLAMNMTSFGVGLALYEAGML